MANYEVVVCDCENLADRNLSASPIPGSIDIEACYSLVKFHGLKSQEINPNKNPLLEPLRSRSERMHKNYATATTELALDASTAIDIANPYRTRKEMHGFHVLPACFKIADRLCSDSASTLKLSKLQISAPIHTNLKLVAYQGIKPTMLSDIETPLYAEFVCDKSKIFVRGVLPKSERPIRYAFDDAIEIGVWRESETTYGKISASEFEFRRIMMPAYEHFKPLIDHNPAVATLMTLELAETFGRKLLSFNELEFGKKIPGRISAFISRVSNFKLHDADALKSYSYVGMKAILNLESAKAGYINNAHLVPIDFRMEGLSEDMEERLIAEGTIIVAGILRDG